MKVYFPLLIATLMLGLIASPASAQCENCTCGQTCQNMCGNVCLDGMVCANCPENPIECVGGTEPYCPTTPIIIDAKNQGFHLTSMKSGVKFTFGASLVQTSWTDADYSNAWLALDRDGNGMVLRDRQLGTTLGVKGTPTMFINGEPLTGLPDAAELHRRLEDALDGATARLAAVR